MWVAIITAACAFIICFFIAEHIADERVERESAKLWGKEVCDR